MTVPYSNNHQYTTIEKTYTVAATYCEPDAGPSKTVQLLTHGIGFDRTYWDLSIHNYNYSYAAVANDEYGYSTFAWDRLGIAESDHGEAVNEIQSSLEIAALYTLTQQLREGAIDGIGCGFDKVVHVGHSFGSIQSYSLAVLHPGASDGLVLTGFSQASQYSAYFALGANFVSANGLLPFVAYPDGYLASGNPSGVETDFFAPGSFDPALLDLASTSGKPVTVGEILTLSGAAANPNPLEGPVLIITGGESENVIVKLKLRSRDTDIPQAEIFLSVEAIACRQALRFPTCSRSAGLCFPQPVSSRPWLSGRLATD